MLKNVNQVVHRRKTCPQSINGVLHTKAELALNSGGWYVVGHTKCAISHIFIMINIQRVYIHYTLKGRQIPLSLCIYQYL